MKIANADRGQATVMKTKNFCGSGGHKPGPLHEAESPGGADPVTLVKHLDAKLDATAHQDYPGGKDREIEARGSKNDGSGGVEPGGGYEVEGPGRKSGKMEPRKGNTQQEAEEYREGAKEQVLWEWRTQTWTST